MGDRAWVQRYFTVKKFFQSWLNDYTHNKYDLNMIVVEHFVRNRRKVWSLLEKIAMLQESRFINPVGLYDPTPNGYTHVVIAPKRATTVYIAGQGGEDKNGFLASDFVTQLKQAFVNLRIALAAADARPEDVVKISTFIVDHSESKLEHLTTEVLAMWGNQTPAQTLVPVPRLALDGMLFEIDAIAVIRAD